ncbi:MAG: hypothetical protein WC043_09910 [Pseudobdellovibrionaceae bacterium]
MSIEIGQLPDGDLALVSGDSFPAEIKRVEYYREQKLFMLIYDIPDHEGDLMDFELRDDVADKVQRCGSMVIVQPDMATGRPVGYYTSVIQIGEQRAA